MNIDLAHLDLDQKPRTRDLIGTWLRCFRRFGSGPRRARSIFAAGCVLLLASAVFGQQPRETMAFTISTGQPSNQLYHVVFRCAGLQRESLDFKMPVWTPGYYQIMDYAANVENFQAEDSAGQPRAWAKTSTNTWQVRCGRTTAITLRYDVRATRSFVANSYLDEQRGYLVPASLCLYPAGQIEHPVTLTILPHPHWSTIATGLDPVSPDQPHTYAAPDFDVLYDSPILMGNLETLPSFEIQGIPHHFVGFKLAAFDRERFMKRLKTVLEAGIAVIGDIPYRHFTFLAIGPGQGGIEHLNSTAFSFTGAGMDTPAGEARELRFLAHEYFHHYNIKRIRPFVLGPFDYDKAAPTPMLWVSEGFTVYYEYLMLRRAGLTAERELLDRLTKDIVAYENNPGHLFQSATESSYTSWTQGPFGGGGRDGIRKTINCYNKGPILGLLLDFKIRHETKNQRSLDTVMRTLYREYYQEKKRGWTDAEFRATCESVAGVPLAENFDYAATTREIDYTKYLGYAGLELEPPGELPDSWLGAIAEDVDRKLIISALESGSPAQRAGLAACDEIKSLDGAPVDAKTLAQVLAVRKPGDTITLRVSSGADDRELSVTLDHKLNRSFRMSRIANLDALQSAILASWEKN